MTYNLKRHIELLNRKKSFNQNKFFFTEHPNEYRELFRDEYSELLKYNAAVDQHIFWGERYEIADLLENFLTKKINCEEFYSCVLGFRRKYIAKCHQFLLDLASEKEELKDFSPNEKAKKLKGFLSALSSVCENFDNDPDEEEFYTRVQNGFFALLKILNEE